MTTSLLHKLILFATVLVAINSTLHGQTRIAITIDDIPNTRKFHADNYKSILLVRLDSMRIPIAIFMNEGLLHKTDSLEKNLELFEEWVSKDYTTLGNHTYSHSRYSEVGFDAFEEDLEKGEKLLGQLAIDYNKPLHHFRFPYNDLGKDSLQHVRIDSALQSRNYISSAFTVESSDWMFNYIYEYYLRNSEPEKALEVGQFYVSATVDYINFFDSLSHERYGRAINQIYLCHDNSLNAEFLHEIIEILQFEGFQFIGLDEAMADEVYHQENTYYRKWGVSWMYRWMDTQKERVQWMKQEPDIVWIEQLFEKLSE